MYSVKVDGGDQKLLLADDTAYGIHPLGWSNSGKSFYLGLVTMQSKWEIWELDPELGTKRLLATLPYPIVESFALSPNGNELLMVAIDSDGEKVLTVVSTDREQERVFATSRNGNLILNEFFAIWSPKGEEILAYIPTQGYQANQLTQIDLGTGRFQDFYLPSIIGEDPLIPLSWSPNGEWIELRQYSNPQSVTFLLRISDSVLEQIPLTKPSNWISLIGWTLR